jgi:hypothetical protein
MASVKQREKASRALVELLNGSVETDGPGKAPAPRPAFTTREAPSVRTRTPAPRERVRRGKEPPSLPATLTRRLSAATPEQLRTVQETLAFDKRAKFALDKDGVIDCTYTASYGEAACSIHPDGRTTVLEVAA